MRGLSLRRIFRISKFQVFLVAGLTLLAVFMLLPIVYIVNHAFKPFHELFLYPPTFIVKQPTVQNFYDLLLVTQTSIVPMSRYLFNSIFSTGLNVLATLLFSVLCAYPLSKHKFPGKNLIFSTIILSLMFAPETVQIPRYFAVSETGIMNTYLAHVLPLVAMPVGVFLMKQFIDQLPDALLEAAKLEGANEWTVFLRIVIPLCMPAVATIGILAFQSSWGNVETSTLFTEDETMKTLPFYVSTLTSGLANNVANQGVAAAVSLLLFIPNFVIFLLLQRKVISTMAHSGIK
ncbi:carbohydrate ABC transporter permease [Paenibacillus contaminans]|uniref:Carbohydrate ABC transporter permease n=1 Tax=Paenibacillus contaminans TaxID=450362 RepID=A0A329MH22_9BACL|nr:carbohydrate ABC transporter permease [Paenibacillus contaminans]